MRPRFCAVRRGANRKIAVETDLQAAIPRALGGPPKLAVGEPLAEKGEFKAFAVALDRMIDRLGLAVAQTLRPGSPVPADFSFGGRLEGGEAPQGLAARSRERMIVGDERVARPRRAEADEGCAPSLERRVLGKPYLLVLDRFCR